MNKPTIVIEESLYDKAKELFGNQYEIMIAEPMPDDKPSKHFNPKEAFVKFRNQSVSKKSRGK
jgi:hypothetical protein